MRIYPEQLHLRLEKDFKSLYLLFGNEPLFKQECQDLICSYAKDLGFIERQSFSVDASTNWDNIYSLCMEMGLFSQKQTLIIHLPESGSNVKITQGITKLAGLIHKDLLVIITGNRLLKRQENAKWFKTLHSQGEYIVCNTPTNNYLPNFIAKRCNQLKLKPDNQAIQMLAVWHEGNLLALAQSLYKLGLIYPDGVLTVPRIKDALSINNNFALYQYIEAILLNQPKRSLKILYNLKISGIEPIIILRSLQKELNQLYSLHEGLQNKHSIQTMFDKLHIWQNKRDLYTNCLNRLSIFDIKQLILQLAQLERESKIHFNSDLWQEIEFFGLNFTDFKL